MERLTVNQEVVGSSPTVPVKVNGSSPWCAEGFDSLNQMVRLLTVLDAKHHRGYTISHISMPSIDRVVLRRVWEILIGG